MTTHRLVVPLNPYHSPTGATSANNFTTLTPFGTAPHARTATIVKHITIPTTTALTPTPYASPNLSVWSPSLTNALPLPGSSTARAVLFRQLGVWWWGHYLRWLRLGSLTIAMTNTWKCQSRRGVMSWLRFIKYRTLLTRYHFCFLCTTIIQNIPERSTMTHLLPLWRIL